MEPFLKIPSRALLAELVTLLTPQSNVARNPKKIQLKSATPSPKLTRTKSKVGKLKFHLRMEFCLLGTESLESLGEVFIWREVFSPWNDELLVKGGDGELCNSQPALSPLIHGIHLQLTSSFPSLVFTA